MLPLLQVARLCIDRAEAVADDSPECRHPATLRMLWQVLGLLCTHRGQLQSPPSALLAEGISDKKPGGEWRNFMSLWHAMVVTVQGIAEVLGVNHSS